MPYVTVGKENSGSIDLYYENHGSGKPIVLIHGYPLSGRAWRSKRPSCWKRDTESLHTIAGGSATPAGRPWAYDYDTFAEDLHKLVTKLDLRDFVLAGHSMGGGEVARYLGTYGTKNVRKAVFVAGVPPFLLKTADNPEGVDGSVFEGIKKAVVADRPAFLAEFCAQFYNVDVLGGKLVSEKAVQASWNISVAASPKAVLDCVDTWGTDFRKDVKRIDIPTLVIQGDADRIVPFANSGKRLPALIKGSKLVVIEGGPHGIAWTHAEQVNRELLDFLGEKKSAGKDKQDVAA